MELFCVGLPIKKSIMLVIELVLYLFPKQQSLHIDCNIGESEGSLVQKQFITFSSDSLLAKRLFSGIVFKVNRMHLRYVYYLLMD